MSERAIQAEMAGMIRALMRALDYAYQGLHTLPADHSARVLYERADAMLLERAK